MAPESQRPDADSTIAEAIALIDPENTLVPGTGEYDQICDLIRCWIDQCGMNMRYVWPGKVRTTWSDGARFFEVAIFSNTRTQLCAKICVYPTCLTSLPSLWLKID